MSAPYSGQAAEAAARAKANKRKRETERAEMIRCIKMLTGVVEDIMPQMGGIVLQDYARLNEGLILSAKILGTK